MQCESFSLLLKAKIFKIPLLFRHLLDISKDISKILIINPDHQYDVQSNVCDDVFQSFLEYLINDKLPEIRIENINEYKELSSEFNILQDIIENKEKEFGEYLINLNGIINNKYQNLSYYEEQISIKLDDYLSKYSTELMKIKISSLYNIFNHESRKLINHNLAYEVICQHFNKTKDSNIFILLDLLDGTKLTKSNIEESFQLRKERLNHMPNIDFSYLSSAFLKQSNFEKQISDLKNKFEEYKSQNEIEKKKNLDEIEKKRIHDEIEKKKMLDEIEKKKIHDEIEKKKMLDEIESYKKESMKLIKNLQKKYEDEINKLNKKIENIILSKEKLEGKKDDNQFQMINLLEKRFFQSVSAELDLKSDGILCQLKKKEKTPFDRLFIVSQSSRDIYNLIDPNTEDDFRTSNSENSLIVFELRDEISINGIKVFSSFEYFPKSFDISINGNVVKSIENADQLNGQNKEMTINFNSVRCKKIEFIQKGPNWDKGSTFLRLKKIELLSDQPEYSNGVFSTLIKMAEKNDPHKCPVYISSNRFDFNHFMNYDPPINICTYNKKNSWFQIEFRIGMVLLTGFRIQNWDNKKLKNYKIICTDDDSKNEELWDTLFEINEQSINENEITDIYSFKQMIFPARFVRLIQLGPNWNDDLYLAFFHFDLFGKYF